MTVNIDHSDHHLPIGFDRFVWPQISKKYICNAINKILGWLYSLSFLKLWRHSSGSISSCILALVPTLSDYS